MKKLAVLSLASAIVSRDRVVGVMKATLQCQSVASRAHDFASAVGQFEPASDLPQAVFIVLRRVRVRASVAVRVVPHGLDPGGSLESRKQQKKNTEAVQL